MISLLVLITVCFVLSSADSSVNWTVDENTVPESLPDLMRNKYYRNEEIQNAVFWAYKIQYDVISEHNGRVYDAETPLEYFNDALILPKTRASLINSNIVFENNTISGLLDFKSNNIVIRWSQDLEILSETIEITSVSEDEPQNEEEVIFTQVTIQQAKDALKTLRNFVETTTGMDDKAFSALNNLEDVVAERSNMKQTLMTDFFKEK